MTDHRADRKRYLEVMLKHHTGNGTFCVATQGGGVVMRPYNPRALMGATHVSFCTYGDEISPSYDGPFRSFSNVVEVLGINMDDVGTKAKKLLMDVTTRIETSPGNFTDGVRFNPPATPEQAGAILASLKAGGYLDKGSADVCHVNRLPGSKPPHKKHVAKLLWVDDDVEYDPATFLLIVGVAEAAYENYGKPYGTPYPPGIDPGPDVVLEWMQDNGHVQGPDTQTYVYKVDCPWIHEHTDQSDKTGAKYFSCEDRWERGFYCHHSHEKTIHDLLPWIEKRGGPCVEVEWSPDDWEPGGIKYDLDNLLAAGVPAAPRSVINTMPRRITESRAVRIARMMEVQLSPPIEGREERIARMMGVKL